MTRRRTGVSITMLALVAVAVLARGCASANIASPTAPATGASVAATAGTSATASAAAPGAVVAVVVLRNVDGDTLHVTMPDGTDESVRFIGVDTPESTIRHDPFGAEASAYTKRRLPKGSAVWLEFDARLRDKYDRLLAYVWLRPPGSRDAADVRGNMFNAQLLLGGYATLLTIPPDVKYVDVFRPMAAEARDANRGLWALEP